MTRVSIHLTTNDLLKGVEQLKGKELDDFVQDVLRIRAKHFADNFDRKESDLMLQINSSSLSNDEHHQLLLLIQKSEAGTLSKKELLIYQSLNTKMETLNLKRLTALSQLANKKGISLEILMNELGL